MPQTDPPDDPDLAAWREIVENYGDRAELPPDAEANAPAAAESGPSYSVRFGTFDDDIDEDIDVSFAEASDPLEDDFVPPEPEPFRLSPARAAAWAGVLGAPVVALLATIVVTSTDLSVPRWFGWLLVAAFLGGFGYLVITMPRDRDDPWDDGARL
ncbi:hypothetical protein [Nocardioides sp. CER19]|uniref:hypothetical protein n=1 Tax=Nocardioides sp. CER19 TaxID=3038538 RepID=UPI002447B6E2|nr:hypothetical protein [Nocardioides sp. CER19]MDH2416744.1 hypothetical protein [Nocardioides sp. CER19]